jgi:hypothetical protein
MAFRCANKAVGRAEQTPRHRGLIDIRDTVSKAKLCRRGRKMGMLPTKGDNAAALAAGRKFEALPRDF